MPPSNKRKSNSCRAEGAEKESSANDMGAMKSFYAAGSTTANSKRKSCTNAPSRKKVSDPSINRPHQAESVKVVRFTPPASILPRVPSSAKNNQDDALDATMTPTNSLATVQQSVHHWFNQSKLMATQDTPPTALSNASQKDVHRQGQERRRHLLSMLDSQGFHPSANTTDKKDKKNTTRYNRPRVPMKMAMDMLRHARQKSTRAFQQDQQEQGQGIFMSSEQGRHRLPVQTQDFYAKNKTMRSTTSSQANMTWSSAQHPLHQQQQRRQQIHQRHMHLPQFIQQQQKRKWVEGERGLSMYGGHKKNKKNSNNSSSKNDSMTVVYKKGRGLHVIKHKE